MLVKSQRVIEACNTVEDRHSGLWDNCDRPWAGEGFER